MSPTSVTSAINSNHGRGKGKRGPAVDVSSVPGSMLRGGLSIIWADAVTTIPATKTKANKHSRAIRPVDLRDGFMEASPSATGVRGEFVQQARRDWRN